MIFHFLFCSLTCQFGCCFWWKVKRYARAGSRQPPVRINFSSAFSSSMSASFLHFSCRLYRLLFRCSIALFIAQFCTVCTCVSVGSQWPPLLNCFWTELLCRRGGLLSIDCQQLSLHCRLTVTVGALRTSAPLSVQSMAGHHYHHHHHHLYITTRTSSINSACFCAFVCLYSCSVASHWLRWLMSPVDAADHKKQLFKAKACVYDLFKARAIYQEAGN